MIFTDDFLNDIADQFYYAIKQPEETLRGVLDEMLLNVEEGEFELANHNAFELIKTLTEATTLGEMNSGIKDTYYGNNPELAKLFVFLSLIKNATSKTDSDIRLIENRIYSIKDIYKNELSLTEKVKKVLPKHKILLQNVENSFNSFEWYNTLRHINNIPTGLFKADPFKEPKTDEGLTIRITYSKIGTTLKSYLF